MYWTDVGTDRIERATMDGNFRTILHSTGLSIVYGLTLDYDSQILYWADASYNRIESSSVNGSNRQILVSSLRNPWGLTFYENILYWTDTSSDSIYSLDLANSSVLVPRMISNLGGDSYDIRIVSEDRQPLG